MTKYNSYSSERNYYEDYELLALKDFFGKDLFKHFEEPMRVSIPAGALSTADEDTAKAADIPTNRGCISIMYLATKDDYKVDYETAMSMYKKFHDKAYEMRDNVDMPIVWYSTGLNRSTMHDAVPMIIYHDVLQIRMQKHPSPLFQPQIRNYEKLLDGCWLTSPMPTIMTMKPTMEGPRFTYTFGKKVPEKNRLVFQVYVVSNQTDYWFRPIRI